MRLRGLTTPNQHPPNRHLSDQQLLLFADGELSSRGASSVRKHLAECWSCRTRLTELEGAIIDFVHIHQSRIETHTPPAAGLRASLKAQMAEAAAIGHKSHLPFFAGAFSRRIATAGVALVLIGIAISWMRSGPLRPPGSAVRLQARALPDRILTPGFTRAVNLNDLCSRQHAGSPPAVDPSTEQTVFREYGLPVSTSKSYELDYLITPELGGADDVRNLWPEPYASTEWNAHVKDELEDRLHTMVCDGRIGLATAQNDIATDWIAAYKRYFHTETPLLNHGNGITSELDDETETHPRPRIVLLAGGFAPFQLLTNRH